MKKLLVIVVLLGIFIFSSCENNSNDTMLASDEDSIMFVNDTPTLDGIAEIVTSDETSLIITKDTIIRYKRRDDVGFVRGDIKMVYEQQNVKYYFYPQDTLYGVDSPYVYVEQVDVW